MVWHIYLLIFTLFAASLLALLATLAAFRQRPKAGAIPLAGMTFAASIWSLASVVEYSSNSYLIKVFWSKVQYLGIVSIPILWLLFTLEYSQIWSRLGQVFRRGLPISLSIIPLITLVLVFTNENHRLIWSEIIAHSREPFLIFEYQHGIGFWIFATYSYVLLLLGTFLLVRTLFISSLSHFGEQPLIIILAILLPWLLNLAYLMRATWLGGIDPTPMAFALSGAIFTWELLRRDLAEGIPIRQDRSEQLRLLNVAFSAAPYPIVITDREGTIQWVNVAFTELTGYTYEEAVGQNPRILKSGQHSQDFYQNLWNTILSGNIWRGEFINKRKDGELYFEEAVIAPVMDQQGHITNFVALKENITSRKELEKMRDDLIHAIVHDMRNPLNSILFSLDLIKSSSEVEAFTPETFSLLELSRLNAWRLLGMINAILDLNRLESGKLPVRPEPTVLAELAEEAIRAQSPIAMNKEVLILNNVPYHLPKVLSDPDLIGRVFQNLLDNAIKFSPQGGIIEISAAYDQANERVVISVHDQGQGIPPSQREQLFQKYASFSLARGGFGLGLVFCRLAVEAHQGQIWVESETDQGTTFFFTLPTVAESTQEGVTLTAVSEAT